MIYYSFLYEHILNDNKTTFLKIALHFKCRQSLSDKCNSLVRELNIFCTCNT